MSFLPAGLRPNAPAVVSGGGVFDYTNNTAAFGALDATNTVTSATTNTINVNHTAKDYYEIFISGTWNSSAGGELDLEVNGATGGYECIAQQWDTFGTSQWLRGALIQLNWVTGDAGASSGSDFASSTAFSFRGYFFWNGSVTSYAIIGGFQTQTNGQASVVVQGTYNARITSLEVVASKAMATCTVTDYVSNI